jgi:Cu(I)/Ag(I) efflux system membrane protein CusA/SilA
VEIVPVYDRSSLIERAVENLASSCWKSFSSSRVVCFIFLFHLRSAFVAIISLPLGILAAFIVMYYQGVNANIMSLGGIAIAIGAMVDAAVVMIENAHKHLEYWAHDHPDENARRRGALEGDRRFGGRGRAGAVLLAADHHAVLHPGVHAGGAGRPVVLAAGLHQDLRDGGGGRPVGHPDSGADGLLIRGRIPDEKSNPLNRFLIAAYRPLLNLVLRGPKITLVHRGRCWSSACGRCSTSAASSCRKLDEGDLLYMPSALPGLSAGKASELLQQTDRLIKTVPEVASVYGKAGRAETATDPAPLEMFETTIQFKPKDQWRAGMTSRQAGRGIGQGRQGAGPGQHLGAADPQPHRHAGHRHQEPGGRQGRRHRPGGDRPATARSSGCSRTCPASAARWPSA